MLAFALLGLFLKLVIGKQLVIFGDNYSVNGPPVNMTVPSSAYQYLFSSNILWTDFLAQRGFPYEVLNYAVGGSTFLNMVDNCPSVKKEFGYDEDLCIEISKGIIPQILTFLDDTEGERDVDDIMVLILFSGNDYILAQKSKEYVKEIPMLMAEQIEEAIKMLLDNGISDIKVATLPPLQWAPYLKRNETYQLAIVQYLFESNAPMIFMSRRYSDAGVELINVEEYLTSVIFAMLMNGINVDVTCLEAENGVCDNDLRFYWLDELNPTSHIHHELASWMVMQLF
eukprot:TRINITY_DN2967_c0_g2_i4.p2 TRINITY_DN2967_c0_g2~~TRINITY_DN2967_c0_g2_i4.p2  ORF type:complete len:284 (-),score=36.20 TRINITY_DN2967_c0_g2_i4:352-1203(-)